MNKKYKPYIAYLLTGIPFSLLTVFFGIVHAIYFMAGMLLGW
jgi:membrane protease YdiL (CAAX protease family)